MENTSAPLTETLAEHLRGGFSPLVDLLREFHYDKSGEVLDGLHFSAYTLVLHMQHRQDVWLHFMRNPQEEMDLWPEAYWSEQYQPGSREEWERAIARLEADVEAMVSIVSDPGTDLLQVRPNGKSMYWAATASLHHNAYHIGQLKAIGRQLGVW